MIVFEREREREREFDVYRLYYLMNKLLARGISCLPSLMNKLSYRSLCSADKEDLTGVVISY